MALIPPRVWEKLLMPIIPFLNLCFCRKILHRTNNIHQNIKFTSEEESKVKSEFIVTFLKWKKKGSLYWFISVQYLLTNTWTTAPATKEVVRKVLFTICPIELIQLSPMKSECLRKINIKKASRLKIFQRIFSNYILSQSQ